MSKKAEFVRSKKYPLSEVICQFMGFRGRTPLKLGMNWGGGDIRALSANNVQMGHIDFSKDAYFGSGDLYRNWMTKGECEKGDILLTTEAPLGNVAEIPDNRKYILSQRVILLKADKSKAKPKYLLHLFQDELFQKQLVKQSTGTTVIGIQQARLARIEVELPPLLQQDKIATILTVLDHAIAHTETLIEKYQHIKAGLMHDLFTRGIGADGKLRPVRSQAPELYKESAIGWIPKDWSHTAVLNCGHVKLGRQRSPDQHSGRWTTPYLRVANVYDGFFDFRDVLEMDFTPSEKEIFSIKYGDILLNEGQSLELVGRCALYISEDNQYCFQNTLIRFRCYENHHPFFYRQLFKYYLDIEKFIEIASQTTSVAHLGAARFSRLEVPEISSTEQKMISEKLSLIDSKIDTERSFLKSRTDQKIGLMHDLLTGKVPVTLN